MTEQDTGLHHAVAPGVTRDETRNTLTCRTELKQSVAQLQAGVPQR